MLIGGVTDESTLVRGRRIKCMVMESCAGRMENATKATILRIRNMAMAPSTGK